MSRTVGWGVSGILVSLAVAYSGGVQAAPWEPVTYIHMELQEVASGAASGVPLPPGHAWYRFANHTHTDHSDGNATVEQRIKEAAKFGADAVSITDHRTLTQCSDSGFAPHDGCTPMCSEEWGSDGHAALLNMSGADAMVGWPWEDVVPAALTRGATIIVNHPKASSDPWPYDVLHAGIAGIEVWNAIFTATSSAEALAWWNGFVAQGQMVFAIGGSDNHLYDWLSTDIFNSNTPCNYVLATSAEPDAIQAGLDAGRLSVAGSEGGSRCFVWCDGDGDGAYETGMGDTIPVPETMMLRFRVEVYDGDGKELRIITGGGQDTESVGSGSPWRIECTTTVYPHTKDYIRAELYGTLGAISCISNPVYVNYTPGDADSDGASDALEQAMGSDPYDADSDDDNVIDGYEAGYDGDAAAYNPYDAVANPGGTDMNLQSADTDGDGVDDGTELANGTNPLRWNRIVTIAIQNYPDIATENTISPAPGDHEYSDQDIVPLTATPAAGWRFSHWEVSPPEASGVVNSVEPSTTVTVDMAKTVNAIFIKTYTLQIIRQGSGAGTFSPPEGIHAQDYNTLAQVTATADPFSAFSHWEGDASGSEPTISVYMNANKTVRGVFDALRTLTMQVSGNGTVNPDVGTHQYAEGSMVPILADPDDDWAFGRWEGGVIEPTSPSTFVLLNVDKTVTAVFGGTYALNVGNAPPEGGVVSLAPAPLPGNRYAAGVEVTLTAGAADGYRFVNWAGDAAGSANPIHVTMDGNKDVTANYSLVYALALSASPSLAGTVVADPLPGPDGKYLAGEEVVLTAAPEEGYAFRMWSGALQGAENPATVVMDASKAVLAIFADAYVLTIDVDPPGAGEVAAAPLPDANGHYAAGTQVTLTATASEGYLFDHWAGGASGTQPGITILMDGNKTLTAAFRLEGSEGEGEGEAEGELPCLHSALPASEPPVFCADFETGLDDFLIENNIAIARGLWCRTQRCEMLTTPYDSAYGLYFGDDLACDYDTGEHSIGRVTSPLIDLTQVEPPITLAFRYFLETEACGCNYDVARVEVSADGGAFEVVAKNDDGQGGPTPYLCDGYGIWHLAKIDLSGYAGQSIQVRFFFDTRDYSNNDHAGFYVDDLCIHGVPAATEGEGEGQEGEGEGQEGEGEGQEGEGEDQEGEGEGQLQCHAADRDCNNAINLSELLRLIQFYNSDGYHCEAGSEDGYGPGVGDRLSCPHHSSDYNAADWVVGLSELLRLIQFYNSGGYCPCAEGEDGFCPGTARASTVR